MTGIICLHDCPIHKLTILFNSIDCKRYWKPKNLLWIHVFGLLFGAQSVAMIGFYRILFLQMIAIIHSPGPLQCYNQLHIDYHNHFCRKRWWKKAHAGQKRKGRHFHHNCVDWQRKDQIFIWLIVESTITRRHAMHHHSTINIHEIHVCWSSSCAESCRCLRHGDAAGDEVRGARVVPHSGAERNIKTLLHTRPALIPNLSRIPYPE